jgi:hypothetical protein
MSFKFRRVALALPLLIALAPAAALGCSMCQCGDPAYRIAGDAFFASRPWRVSLDVDRYGKDQPAEADPALRERESETRVTVAAAWMPRPWLRVVGRLPLTSRVITAGDERQSLAGLADPDVTAHLRLAGDTRRWLAFMAGVRAPWGQNTRVVDGVRADEHLQPGTGATAGIAGLAASADLGAGRHVYASVSGRTADTNASGYRYGDVLLGTLAAQRDLGPRAAGVIELDARTARVDRQDGADVENSGGTVAYVTPRIQFSLGGPAVLKLGVQVPLAQDLIGDQHEHTNLLGGLTIVF